MIVTESQRLVIKRFEPSDTQFILRLLNQESFIANIADKQVRNTDDALGYLKNGPMKSYESFGFGLNLVMLKPTSEPIGMCGILKRPELEHPDIGYAFLDDYCGYGYAAESAIAVLESEMHRHDLNIVQAVTLIENERSNKLLVNIGFSLQSVIDLYDKQNNLYEFKV